MPHGRTGSTPVSRTNGKIPKTLDLQGVGIFLFARNWSFGRYLVVRPLKMAFLVVEIRKRLRICGARIGHCIAVGGFAALRIWRTPCGCKMGAGQLQICAAVPAPDGVNMHLWPLPLPERVTRCRWHAGACSGPKHPPPPHRHGPAPPQRCGHRC